MTTLHDIQDWVTKIAALFTVLEESQTQVRECQIRLLQARKLDHKKAETKWQQELEYAQRQLDLIHADLHEATGTWDVQAAYDMATDVRVRASEAAELHEQWRKALAAYERLSAAGALDQEHGYTSVEGQNIVATAQRYYTLQLQLAIDKIPQNTEINKL